MFRYCRTVSFHISLHVIHISCCMVKYSFPDSILELKMGDSLETRINTIEHIQEEFGHDIQEMERQIARLTKLIEGHTGIVSENIHGSPFIPLQSSTYPLVQHPHPNHEPRIPIRGNVPPRVHHPNWQPHASTPAIIPAFGKVSQLVDLASSSRNNLEKPRRNRDKSRWDPILVTYTELLPKLWKGNWLHYHIYFLSSHHFPSHTIPMSIVIIIWGN